MVSKTLTIENEQGLHMRPAGIFAKEMAAFQSDVQILFDGKKINAKSVMNIISGCIKCGSEITLECSGSDEQAALDKATELIASGFGE
jgi:phosphocarrier protein